MSKVDVVVTYLELDAAVARQATTAPSATLSLERVLSHEAANVAARMYRAVGGPWHWTDRLPWSDADWTAAVNRDDVELWVARLDGEIVGYFELQVEADAVELKYFGLIPEFTGRRIGGALLSASIERARELGKPRVTVNTCTLDHPAALANYLKGGFTIVRTETQHRTISA
jgi:ribosomal protein S18 acetylase RimI-like enzyme